MRRSKRYKKAIRSIGEIDKLVYMSPEITREIGAVIGHIEKNYRDADGNKNNKNIVGAAFFLKKTHALIRYLKSNGYIKIK